MTISDEANEGEVGDLLEEIERRGEHADPTEVADADRRLDELLEKVEMVPEAAAASDSAVSESDEVSAMRWPAVQTRTARVVNITADQVNLRVRGAAEPFSAKLAPGVSPELVSQAITNADHVVIECEADGSVYVVGVLQTRVPRELTLTADKIHIDARHELLLRSGRGAMRIRQDGDVELVGSRISAMSRGLFRLVGRVLRLN